MHFSKIVFVKNSPCIQHVRVSKFIDYFRRRNVGIEIWCWLRDVRNDIKSKEERYIFRGGGYSNLILVLYYPIWMFVLFFCVLFSRSVAGKVFFCSDFDSSFPVWFASKLRADIRYIYDVHDDFELRYSFGRIFGALIRYLDCVVKSNALLVIHVDSNRVRDCDKNYIVIHNSPVDRYIELSTRNRSLDTFAVTGLLSFGRGLCSIMHFAKENPGLKFLCAGALVDSFANDFIQLPNVHYLGYLSQDQLFERIRGVGFIFSLYEPNSQINRLAASNKLYDALMLGIPVVVNNGLSVTDWVIDKNVGVVVDYEYGPSWSKLVDIDLSLWLEIGSNGRRVYLSEFEYQRNFKGQLDQFFEVNSCV